MDGDAELLQLNASIRRANDRCARTEEAIANLRQMFEVLLQILQARGQLSEGHLRVLDKLREHARERPPAVELGDAPDKYAVVNSEVDCAARMHLCHGRCCSFNVKLSRQDLEEGQLAWRIDEPYYLRQNAEGYCVYQQRDTGFCGTYHNRPAPCRSYTCRQDARIWIDFDKMIPAPMPDGLVTIRRRPAAGAD